jgi:adenylate kinase
MSSGVRLIVLGKQGAGKGTQCVRLSHRYAIPHISTGDMLRAAVRNQTALGKVAGPLMDAGSLLGDDLIMSIVSERLSEPDAATRGFILDGVPRTVTQAELLEEKIGVDGIDCVINLDVPTDDVLQRLVSRRVCGDCGAIYSTNQPPAVNWTCDNCGGQVVQRNDDTAEAILKRLAAYEAETLPLVGFYQSRGKVVTIDGSRSADHVFEATVAAIKAATAKS